MSALAARRSEFQASLNQSQGQKQNGDIASAAANGTMTTAAGDGNVVRWTTADDRALAEAVGRARTGLLFVGVKS